MHCSRDEGGALSRKWIPYPFRDRDLSPFLCSVNLLHRRTRAIDGSGGFPPGEGTVPVSASVYVNKPWFFTVVYLFRLGCCWVNTSMIPRGWNRRYRTNYKPCSKTGRESSLTEKVQPHCLLTKCHTKEIMEFCTVIKHLQLRSPPAWTQEAYRPSRIKYSICTWPGYPPSGPVPPPLSGPGQGTPSPPPQLNLARSSQGVPLVLTDRQLWKHNPPFPYYVRGR